jgi:hypothetical protein
MDTKQVTAINNAMSFLVMAATQEHPEVSKKAFQLKEEQNMKDAGVDSNIIEHFQYLCNIALAL